MDKRPIGVLDSGVGGLTVVRELMRQLPHEEVIYIGDSARAPYGPRPARQILEYTWQLVNFLLSKDVKMIVIACNTATAVALEEIKKEIDVPILGVILPGSRAAIKSTKTDKVGVIGTKMTIESDSYRKVINLKSPKIKVYSLACPRFVPLVESNEVNSSLAKKVIYESLQELTGKVDTLVLGCTHYPLLRPIIQNVMGTGVKLIDSGAETVSDISMLLDYFQINGIEQEILNHKFYTTANVQSFKEIADTWLNQDVEVEHVDL
ncbi:glutamate racemase [Floricoccus penangensis]|uniref:Glutamate racemase n=1 Tax=Floricoccus penangensis TaxID=1859475 RepID=A0A9Q5JHN5_9LACT|nr:glutamate racemase [Floricoccus penangensis]OFI47765.1 glutamate racemase [Floricoccus penangensis]